jgi:hypothetical protein
LSTKLRAVGIGFKPNPPELYTVRMLPKSWGAIQGVVMGLDLAAKAGIGRPPSSNHLPAALECVLRGPVRFDEETAVFEWTRLGATCALLAVTNYVNAVTLARGHASPDMQQLADITYSIEHQLKGQGFEPVERFA